MPAFIVQPRHRDSLLVPVAASTIGNFVLPPFAQPNTRDSFQNISELTLSMIMALYECYTVLTSLLVINVLAELYCVYFISAAVRGVGRSLYRSLHNVPIMVQCHGTAVSAWSLYQILLFRRNPGVILPSSTPSVSRTKKVWLGVGRLLHALVVATEVVDCGRSGDS